jgi:hypothetical protein
MRLLTLILALLFLPLASERAMGEEWNKDEIRVITPTEATSKCIGDPRSPICAVETLMACFVRKTRSLCDMVGAGDVDDSSLKGDPGSTRYRITSVKTILQKDIAKRLRNTDWMQPGNVHVSIKNLTIRFSWCQNGCSASYYTRKVDNKWIVVDHSVEGVD